MQNLTDILRWRGECQPDRLAFRFLADGEEDCSTLDYASLDQDARMIAAVLQQVCWFGDRVLLLFPAGLDYIRAFAGCLYAGCISVTAYPPKARRSATDSSWQRLQAIASDADARVVLTTSTLRERLQSMQHEMPELGKLCWIAVDMLTPDEAQDWQPPLLSPETLAFLQYTSGSTATPKGVMVSHRNLLHNLEHLHRGMRTTPESVLVGWLPLFHDMGLIGLMLHALYMGIPYTFFSPATFIQKPLRWLEAISRYRGTANGAPNFAYDLCVDRVMPEERETLDLSCWDVACNGAEPVRAETLARFADAFRPCGFRADAFNPCYGLAEATLVVSIGFQRGEPVVRDFDAEALERRHALLATADSRKSRALVGCGTTVEDQRTIIVDPETRELCPPGTIGEIWIQGASVGQGYWRRPEETRETFQATLADGVTGPFLRTGDLGFCHEGQLYISGRLKDVVIIRGANHYPQDIEATVERCHPALRAAGCAVFCIEEEGEARLVVAQELQRTALQSDLNEIYAAIRAAIAEEHGIQAHAIALLKPGGVPKTTSGKVQRSACREAWRKGDLNLAGVWQQAQSLAPMPPESEPMLAVVGPSASRRPIFVLPSAPEEQLPALEAYLHACVQRLLGLVPEEVIARNRSLSGVGLDSLMIVELKNHVERELKVVIPTGLLMQGPSLAQLAAVLHEQMAPRMPLPPLPSHLTASAVANLSDAEVDRMLALVMKNK